SEQTLEPLSLRLRLFTFVRVARQALLELGETTAELGLAHLDTGGPYLEAGPQRTDRAHALLQALARRAQGLEALGAGRFLSFEGREDVGQLCDPSRFAADALRQFVQVDAHGVALNSDVAPLGLQPAHRIRRGGELTVVFVQPAMGGGDGAVGGLKIGCRLCGAGRVRGEKVRGLAGALAGVVEGRRRHAGARSAEAPRPPAEAVAGTGDDGQAGVGEGGVE